MRLRITHTTRYVYPGWASESHNEARLMPLTDEDQACLDFRLHTSPPARLFAYDTPSGRVHHFDIREPHSELIITGESLVLTRRSDPFAGLQFVTEDEAYYQRDAVREQYAEFLTPTERVPLHPETDRIAAVARKATRISTASFLINLTRLLNRVLTYAPGATTVNTPIKEVIENQRGVCQDFAHLMLAICRRQGIPARYVSGYLYTGTRPKGDEETNSYREMIEEGANGAPTVHAPLLSGDAMHAWVECLLPDGTWHGFDPTNNLVTNDLYVKVHYGRDYGDALPLFGVYRGPAASTMDVAVRVLSDPI